MATLEQATLSDLVAELERADVALSLGFSRKEERKWMAYRRAVQREIERRCPIDPATKRMTDAELLRALES